MFIINKNGMQIGRSLEFSFWDLMPHVIAFYGKNRLPGDMVQKMGGEAIDLGNRPSMEEIVHQWRKLWRLNPM